MKVRIGLGFAIGLAVVASAVALTTPVAVAHETAAHAKTQIRDLAAFLAKYSGGYKTCTECKGIVPSGFPTG